MNYIDRRFLFPVAAVTAWAQQPSPASPEVEAALRARVEQYYQLQVDRKFRQAEAMVAEDSKDDYYNRAKQDIKGFSIKQIEWLDNNRARVTIAGKVVLKAPLIGSQEFEMPLLTSWKVENGQWVWYIDPDLRGRTPFGKIAIDPSAGTSTGGPPPSATGIDPATLLNQVTLDGTSVTLNASNPVQTVTVTNHLPGPITLKLTKPELEGVSIEIENSDLKAGEKSAIRFSLKSETKPSGVVRLVAAPINQVFEIQVHSN